jgi:hypothetical protein
VGKTRAVISVRYNRGEQAPAEWCPLKWHASDEQAEQQYFVNSLPLTCLRAETTSQSWQSSTRLGNDFPWRNLDMISMRTWGLPLCLVVAGAASLLVGASDTPAAGYRQYYGNWHTHHTGYYHRVYYYKPVVTYPTYHTHYCVYYPTRPSHYYYYNPYKQQYWGRCPLHSEEPVYSLLAEEDRKPTIQQIPEQAFPEPAKPPAVPESQDQTPMVLSPNDLPNEASVAVKNPPFPAGQEPAPTDLRPLEAPAVNWFGKR